MAADAACAVDLKFRSQRIDELRKAIVGLQRDLVHEVMVKRVDLHVPMADRKACCN